jgi:alkylhydroperoxidase family enzyme
MDSGAMTAPFVAPKPIAEWDPEIAGMAGNPTVPGAGTLNIFATLANHPKLMKRWLVFGNHVLAKSTLSARDRELLILRTGWNCASPYEWGQHVVIAKACGVTDAEIAAVATFMAHAPDPAGAGPWSEVEDALLRAADELHADACIAAATWATLAAHYDEQQMLDIVFTVGQYHLVAMALNSCRVRRDDGVDETTMPFPVHPDLRD